MTNYCHCDPSIKDLRVYYNRDDDFHVMEPQHAFSREGKLWTDPQWKVLPSRLRSFIAHFTSSGHMCCLFTRRWEMVRLFLLLGNSSVQRGAGEPPGWEDRFSIDIEQRSENWLLYERDVQIQEDMEWLAEAVYQFYQVHLDRLIRESDKLWGDFCRRKFDADGSDSGLELNTFGYDMTIPGMTAHMNKNTAIPDPEAHFSFSTKLIVLGIELYLRDAPRDFCHYTNFAYKKPFQLVEGRKDMTAQSYRFFVEHAYSQFFQHEAFNQSALARTRTKDLSAGEFHSSTKLDGYVWIATRDKIVHIPKDHAEDDEMQEGDAEEEDEQEDALPTLEVSIRPQPREEENQKEEDACSQKREETSNHSGHSEL